MPHTAADKFVSTRMAETPANEIETWLFTSYVSRRWRVFAIACGLAILIVLAASLLMPKKYSATVSILIEPPAGNDPRGTTAISPIYLESLKTYEHFASSESLFARAMDSLDLRRNYAGVPIETVKRRVLDVSKPRDTKILQITATLRNPVQSRDLARFIARETVAMNRTLDRASVAELAESTQGVLGAAVKRLADAKAARAQALINEPIAGLEADVTSANELSAYLQRELSAAETDTAAYESRTGGAKQGPVYMDSDTAKQAATAARAQADSLRGQLKELNAELSPKANLLEQRKHHRELLDKELLAAQQEFETAMTHQNEILESGAFRGERLEIIDPGVVPQKPSSPNILLNVAIAAAAALLGSFLYLAISFAQKRRTLHFS